MNRNNGNDESNKARTKNNRPKKIAENDLCGIQWRGEEDVPSPGICFLSDRAGHEDRREQTDQSDLAEGHDREGIRSTLGQLTQALRRAQKHAEEQDDHQDRQVAASDVEMPHALGAPLDQAHTDGVGEQERKEPIDNSRHHESVLSV